MMSPPIGQVSCSRELLVDLRVHPITSPLAFGSGPPELPWLNAASVWIALSIGKLFSAVSARSTALTVALSLDAQ